MEPDSQGYASFLTRAVKALTELRRCCGLFAPSPYQYVMLPVGLLLFGAGLRLWHFASGRSLWLDEANVAASISTRDWAGLLRPLDHGQVAPIGWLLIEKAMFDLLGSLEYALRLPQLAFGLGALILFALLARRMLGAAGYIVAIALFSLSPQLVYYSANVKHYGVDAALSVVLLALGAHHFLSDFPLKNRDLFALLLVGAIAVTISFPAVFVLAALGALLFIREMKARRFITGWAVAFISAIWAAIFLYLQFSFHRTHSGNVGEMASEWAGGFAPFLPLSKSAIKWYLETPITMFRFMFGEASAIPAALAAGIGALALTRKDAWLAALLIGPFFIALAISSFRLYPFGGRLILVFLPQLILLIGFGVDTVIEKIRTPISAALVALVAVGYGSATSLWGEFTYYPAPYASEHMRPVLELISNRRQGDEPIYVDRWAMTAFSVYQDRVGLGGAPVIQGKEKGGDLGCLLADIDVLRQYPRAWVLYSHSENIMGQPEEVAFQFYADLVGRQLFAKHSISVHAFLYEFGSIGADRFTSILRAFPPRPTCK